MKEEPLHPWIEPELEARIVALVLGEASDFEREELERMIEKKSELAMFKKRTEAVHGLLRDVATGEAGAEDDDWKLSDEKRNAVLAVIDGEVKEKPVENVIKEPVGKQKSGIGDFFSSLAKIAAVLCIVGIFAIIMMMGTASYKISPDSDQAALYSPHYFNQKESTTNSASSFSRGLVASSAEVAEADYEMDSKSALSSIQESLGRYAAVTTESAKPASGPELGYNSHYNFIKQRNEDGSRLYEGKDEFTNGISGRPMVSRSALQATNGKAALSFPEPSDRQSTPFAAVAGKPVMPGITITSSTIAIPEVESPLTASTDDGGAMVLGGQSIAGIVTLNDGTKGFANKSGADDPVNMEVSSRERLAAAVPSSSAKQSFESSPLPTPSVVAPKLAQTEIRDVTLGVVEQQMAEISGFGDKTAKAPANRRNLTVEGLAQTDLALKKSVTDSISELESVAGTRLSRIQANKPANSSQPSSGIADARTAGNNQNGAQQKLAITAGRKIEIAADGRARGGTAVMGGGIGTEASANGAQLNESNKEISKSRKLAEKAPVSARGSFGSPFADAPQKPGEPMSAGRGGGTGKKEAAQDSEKDFDSFAVTIPVTAPPAPAAAPMPSREDLERSKRKVADPEGEERAKHLSESAVIMGFGQVSKIEVKGNQTTGDDLRYVGGEWKSQPGALKSNNEKMGELGYKLKATEQRTDRNLGRLTSAQTERQNKLVQMAAATKSTPTDPKDPMAMEEIDASEEEGFFIRGAQLNDVFQFLAKSADLNYFHNAELSAPNYVVTGPLQEGDPIKQMQELGSKYGINIRQKGETVYAMSNEQLAQAPDQSGALHAGPAVTKADGDSIDSLVASTNAINGNKEDGFFIRNAQLNDVFTFLAKNAGLNYFHNPSLTGDAYKVTGHLQSGDPLSQMEELAYMYGITFLQNGGTVQSLKPLEKKSSPPSGLNEKSAEEEAFSTFSLHVSDVSFKLAQTALAKGEWPDAAKVRIEEFVNAFDYGDPMPNQNEKVACRLEQAIHPFLQQRNLMRVSMRTAAEGRSGSTPLRLTFLLDNSGSMERIDRQETVRRAFALLAQQLKPIDQVTLISFARQPRLLADKVSGAKSRELVQLIHNLPSEGGTNLEAALQLAFEKAREQQVDNAQNRIIMLTDGAANLGDAKPESLSRMIETMRDAGIAFDAAGIGAEGLNDEILEALTRKGDGRYYLLDRPEDADAGFARQIAGALRPAAKNVKVQIEFNPKRVGRYKLLGFEKHRLKKEDFRNDKVDAAEMAAAEAGVAVYQFEAKPDGEGDVGSVSVRFRDMSTGLMVENRWPIPYEADAPRPDQAPPSLRIATSAALFAAKLKGEPLGQSVDLKTLSNLVAGLPDRHRKAKRVQQLQQMINQARQVSGK